MKGLIEKSGYIQPGGGGAGAYLRYIAMRDAVELLTGTGPATPKQKGLIQNLLRDSPDSQQLPEYKEYQERPTVSTASSFISAAMDDNAHRFRKGDQYMKYIAERPRSHGLFTGDGPADLEQTMAEINQHAGPVWTFIYSLKQEDAARVGYDRADSWRSLLRSHQAELVKAMKISPTRENSTRVGSVKVDYAGHLPGWSL